MIKESFLSGPGGRLWYSIYGADRPGIPLLVLHGGPGFVSMPEVVSELSDERPVIFYDQLGCGRSERPSDKSRYTLDYYVEELAAVREGLGLSELHILGQSWGTLLAVEAVLRAGPADVRSLILSGPFLSTPRWEQDQRNYLRAMPEAVQRTVAEAERTGDFGGAYSDAMMAFYRRHVCRLDPWPDCLLTAFRQMNPDVYVTMWGPSEFTTTGTLKGYDLMPRLHELSLPVLLVSGEFDEAAPETVKAYRDQLPRGSMAILPGASHLHHLEQPELFTTLLRRHLRS